MPTVDTCKAHVLVPGGGKIVRNTYIGDGSATFKKGDLVRVTTSGTLKDAAVNSTTTGPIHGMILEDVDTADTAVHAIFEFASDTVIKMQLYAGAAADAEPQDVAIGTSYTLRNGAAGLWSVTVTTSNGIATVVGKAGDAKWFESTEAVDEDYGWVYVSFAQALLDAHSS